MTTWLGDNPLSTFEIKGRVTRPHLVEVPMQQLLTAGPTSLAIAVSGTGRYYWSAALTSTVKADVSARDQGIHVTRRVTGPPDPRPLDAARRGQMVVVSVTVASPTDLDRLVIVCPVPAGLAPINMDFRTAPERVRRLVEAMDPYGESLTCTYRSIRDDRVECFVDRLAAGLHVFRFAARAVVPGRFAFPAATAQEMYRPATFGSSEASQFVVE